MMESEDLVRKSVCSFTSNIYKTYSDIDENKKENVFMSPLSIYIVLSMLLSGSSGNTMAELLKVLVFPIDHCHRELICAVGNLLVKCFVSSEFVNLSSANCLFVDAKKSVKKDYKGEMCKIFKSGVEQVNFSEHSEEARTQINKWVETTTGGKIVDFLPTGSVNNSTVSVVANTLYFRGAWQLAFNKAETREREFTKLDGTSMNVDMMGVTGTFENFYLKDLRALAVKLPFRNSSWTMLIILPDVGNNIMNLVAQLSLPDALGGVLKSDFWHRKIRLYLPRFKLNPLAPMKMEDVLKEMGLNDAFSDDMADFSNMLDNCRTYISSFYHKAILEVDEEGAVAAAATAAVSCELRCRRDPLPIIEVNRPFFISLVCDGGIPVFLGHICVPESLTRQ